MSLKHIIGGIALGVAMFVGSAAAEAPKKAPPAEKPAEKPKGPAKAKVAVVDINSASQKELEAIPEIGTEHCHHIIMGRPYDTTEQLVTKNVLPKATYEKIKDRVVANKDTKPKK